MGLLDDVANALNQVFNAAQLRREAWQRFARERGGTYNPPSGGFFVRRDCSIDIPLSDALVHVDTYVVSNGKTSTTYTRFRSKYLLHTGPHFKVYRSNLFGEVGTALGFEDVSLGDPAFDRAFIVRSSDVAGTQRAWTPSARALMHRLGSGRTQGDGATVSYVVVGAVRDPRVLAAGCELVAALSDYGADWFSVARGLPGATYFGPQGPYDNRSVPHVRMVVKGTEAQIYPTLDHLGLTLVAAVEVRRSIPSFSIRVDESGAPVDPLPPDVVPSDAMTQVRKAAPLTVAHDGRWVRVTLHGPESQARLLAGAELAALVGGGSTSRGAFR